MLVQDAPKRVGDVVAQHHQQEVAMAALRGRKLALVMDQEEVTVDDEHNERSQYADDRVCHLSPLTPPAWLTGDAREQHPSTVLQMGA